MGTAPTFFAAARSDDAETPLLRDTVDGAVDYRGRPVARSASGGWRSAGFIIGSSDFFVPVPFFQRRTPGVLVTVR